MGFIKQMNAKAKHLGMSDTHFEDPHGLGNNVSTARDLLKLSHVAMKNPTFQQYVSTNRHPIAIRSTKGIVRNVTWNNTNKLLSQPYFDGIKTGHSNPANGCLLLSGTYNNKR
ncbi:MAG TPA: D-alanyl-D-alanine carboxypeptidase, partial [Gammaproteobacteria bacterium]|nr:D-alanyl-D-alanine carboxypeptidase [Gammaproteobacteria bacterium]